jgi:hypothetical protein
LIYCERQADNLLDTLMGAGYRLPALANGLGVPGPFAFSDGGFKNHRKPFLFRDTMLELIHSDNLECKELTSAAP